MWSCFEDLVIRKIMTQSKFDLNAQFDSYNFFRLGFACMWVMSKLFVYYMHAQILFSVISFEHTLPHSIHMQNCLTIHLHAACTCMQLPHSIHVQNCLTSHHATDAPFFLFIHFLFYTIFLPILFYYLFTIL